MTADHERDITIKNRRTLIEFTRPSGDEFELYSTSDADFWIRHKGPDGKEDTQYLAKKDKDKLIKHLEHLVEGKQEP